MYNPNNPSNWSWSKAFDEMNKTVNQAELTPIYKSRTQLSW